MHTCNSNIEKEATGLRGGCERGQRERTQEELEGGKGRNDIVIF